MSNFLDRAMDLSRPAPLATFLSLSIAPEIVWFLGLI
jgi:hypothetical protein